MVTEPIWFGSLIQVTNHDARDHGDSSINNDWITIA